MNNEMTEEVLFALIRATVDDGAIQDTMVRTINYLVNSAAIDARQHNPVSTTPTLDPYNSSALRDLVKNVTCADDSKREGFIAAVYEMNGGNKIAVIKLMREIYHQAGQQLGLKEAKDMVDVVTNNVKAPNEGELEPL